MKKLHYWVEMKKPSEEKGEPALLEYGRICPDSALEAVLAIAKAEAVGGEVTVEDVDAPVDEPTQLDIIEAQLTYTAMMTDTLLQEV